MKLASKGLINELFSLENKYFELKNVPAKETQRCMLRGELVKGFVKSEECVNEAIEKLTAKIEELKQVKTEVKIEVETKKEEQKLPAGVIIAKYDGFDAETNERIAKGDWIVKTEKGYCKIENAY